MNSRKNNKCESLLLSIVNCEFPIYENLITIYLGHKHSMPIELLTTTAKVLDTLTELNPTLSNELFLTVDETGSKIVFNVLKDKLLTSVATIELHKLTINKKYSVAANSSLELTFYIGEFAKELINYLLSKSSSSDSTSTM